MRRQIILVCNLLALVSSMTPHPDHPQASWDDFTILAYDENVEDDRPLAPASWEDFTIEDYDLLDTAPAAWQDFTLPGVLNVDKEGNDDRGECSLPSQDALLNADFSYADMPPGWQDFISAMNFKSETKVSPEVAPVAETAVQPENEKSPDLSKVSPEVATVDETSEFPVSVPTPAANLDISESEEEAESLLGDSESVRTESDLYPEESISTDEDEKIELLKRVLLTVNDVQAATNETQNEMFTNSTNTPKTHSEFAGPTLLHSKDAPLQRFWQIALSPMLSLLQDQVASFDLSILSGLGLKITTAISTAFSDVRSKLLEEKHSNTILAISTFSLKALRAIIAALSSSLYEVISDPNNRTSVILVVSGLLLISLSGMVLLTALAQHSKKRKWQARRRKSRVFNAYQQPEKRKKIPRESRHWYEKVDGFHGMVAV